MAVQAADIRLPIRTSKQTRTLEKDVIEVAEADYLFVLRSIAAQEIAEQARLGNKVTNLIVDGSGNKPITAAQRSVRALFVQPAVLIRAITEAWDLLMRLARVGDPSRQSRSQRAIVARERFGVVIGRQLIGTPAGLTEAAIMRNPRAAVRIVGPAVEYARRYRFMYLVRGTLPMRTRRGKGRAGEKIRVPVSLHQYVVRQMKRRYPMLQWSDPWVPVGGLRGVDKLPAISVRQQGRGLL
jgi:hypothetical protein